MGCCTSKKAKESASLSETLSIKKPINAELTIENPPANEESPTKRTEVKKDPISNPKIKIPDGKTEGQDAVIQEKKLSPNERGEILKVLQSHFIFNSLSNENMLHLVSEFKLYIFLPSKVVFSEGSPGQNFYIIHMGSVEVVVNSEVKTVLSKGDSFGELALLHDSPRTATIRTAEKSMFWVLSRDTFRSAVKSINDAKMTENKQFLDKIPVFTHLTRQQKDSLLPLLVVHEFSNGEKIVKEGDTGDLLYIIKKGTVSCSIGGVEIRKLIEGDFFGEQVLLYKTNRTATVEAVDKVSLLSLKCDDLIGVLGSHLQNVIYKNSQRMSMEKSEILKKLTKKQIEVCVNAMKIKTAAEGRVVIKQNSSRGQKILFILKGSLSSSNTTLDVFSCIGDEDIYNNNTSLFEENWTSKTECDLAIISKSMLEKLLGGPLRATISKNEIMDILKHVQILRSLPTSNLESLINQLQIKEYTDNQVIFTQGAIGDAFYIIKKGRVEVFKDKVSLRIINRHDFFGERAILFNEARTATVISRGAVCWVLSKEHFLALVDKGLRKNILKRIELQNDKVGLEDLNLVKQLGSGMFGNVFLAHNYRTKMSYALKTVNRTKIAQFDISKSLVLERRILMQIDHPLIVKLVKTFKDQTRVYFLMELVQGMDLFDVIREIDVMDDEKSMFYIGCLALILEHLHERNIIYRDLKPENIMVDEFGYAKLVDFGTANIITDRTYTVVGTAHYMAPEIIKGTGYSLEADLWSLGIILYEFISNIVPFGEGEDDPYRVYNLILNSELIFHGATKKMSCTGLIEKLLNKNPSMRGNCETLIKNSWFKGLDWEMLINKQIKPPYIPKVQSFKKDIDRAMSLMKDPEAFIRSHEEPGLNMSSKCKSASDWDKEF